MNAQIVETSNAVVGVILTQYNHTASTKNVISRKSIIHSLEFFCKIIS